MKRNVTYKVCSCCGIEYREEYGVYTEISIRRVAIVSTTTITDTGFQLCTRCTSHITPLIENLEIWIDKRKKTFEES